MALFITRYISCLFMFLLGLKAPGITQNIDYFNLHDTTRNVRIQQVCANILVIVSSFINE